MAAKGTTKTSLPAKDLEALGAPRLAHLQLRLETLRSRAASNPQEQGHSGGRVHLAMLDISDVQGDAEAYLAEHRLPCPRGADGAVDRR